MEIKEDNTANTIVDCQKGLTIEFAQNSIL